ncbi:Hypothetical protein NTJ_16043 [Nesidiocoris tenuis]|uniref:Uncharacterized protein n=1 Tax=Nesidiocoris tenuis TaxID=355587 RepID=A0ABN7BG11_9HEMI|nr:Hypothetical protein NTJ_16043 [Nesidiocoris tenuis]
MRLVINYGIQPGKESSSSTRDRRCNRSKNASTLGHLVRFGSFQVHSGKGRGREENKRREGTEDRNRRGRACDSEEQQSINVW